MKERRDGFRDTRSVERHLASLFTKPQPDHDFEAGLRERLARRALDLQREGAAASTNSATRMRVQKRRLAYGLGLLLLALAIVYHRPVLAAMQRLLNTGYLFDTGFVDLSNTRVLEGPTSQVRGASVLTVTQALSTPETTRIWLQFEGPERTVVELDGRLPGTWLEAEDGLVLEPVGWGISGDVLDYVDFGGLPADVARVTLVMPPDWRIPLQLKPAADVEGLAAVVYPDACLNASGVELCVAAAAFDEQGTHILLAGQALDPRFRLSGGLLTTPHPLTGEDRPLLRDDQGRVVEPIWVPGSSFSVEQAVEEPPGGFERATEALHFEPLPAGVTALTLHVPALAVVLPVDAAFEIDLGDSPQVGDIIAVDAVLEVDGQVIHFEQAEIADDPDYGVVLKLTSLPVEPRSGRLVTLLTLEVSSPPGDSQQTSLVGGGDETRQIEIWFDLEDDEGQVPGGVRRVTVVSAHLTLLGPFELTWQMPSQP